MEIIKLLKENILVIIAFLMIIIVFFNVKSNFTSNISNVTYAEDNCYKDLRVYPSGKIPGSYLGLSRQEIDNLLPKFILNKS